MVGCVGEFWSVGGVRFIVNFGAFRGWVGKVRFIIGFLGIFWRGRKDVFLF